MGVVDDWKRSGSVGTLDFTESYMLDYCLKRPSHQVDGKVLTVTRAEPEFEEENYDVIVINEPLNHAVVGCTYLCLCQCKYYTIFHGIFCVTVNCSLIFNACRAVVSVALAIVRPPPRQSPDSVCPPAPTRPSRAGRSCTRLASPRPPPLAAPGLTSSGGGWRRWR